MIPRIKPKLGFSEIFAALNIFQASPVKTFENKFAKKMGQKYGVSFPYGRTGLIALLKMWGFKNKEVICPAYTCVVVPHAIVKSGNIPAFIDSRESDFNMDLNQVEKAINKNTVAIVATSIFGYPVDLDHLDRIRKKHPHIKIIQDCAHSFAASWKRRPVQKEGDCALFGMNMSKLMTSIFGGMITTDDEKIYNDLQKIKKTFLRKPSVLKSFKRFLYLMAMYPVFFNPFYGLINKLIRMKLLDNFVKYYDENKIDLPEDYLEGLTNIEARVGLAQLKKYNCIISERRRIAKYYDEMLTSNKNIKKPPIIEGATYSHYVIQVKNKKDFMNYGIKYGIEFGEKLEYCIPFMKAYGIKSEKFKIAKYFSEHVANYPFSQKETVSKVIRAYEKEI